MSKFGYFLCVIFFVATTNPVFASKKSDRDIDSIAAMKLQKEGTAAGKLGDFELALDKFIKVYNLREKMYGNKSIKLASPLINIGITYKNFGNLDKAIEYYKRAEKLCIDSSDDQNSILGTLYINIGNIYRIGGDYNQALEYQKNAYRILKTDSLKFVTNLQVCKLNIIEINLKLGYSKEAIKIATSSLKFISGDLKPNLYDLLAQAYLNLNEYKLSEKNYLLAIDNWIKLYGQGNVELISEYLAYSSMLLVQKQFDKALIYIKKSNELVLKFFNEKSTQHSDVLSNYGDYYYLKSSESDQLDDFRKKRKESLSSSLIYYQKSIMALVDSFHVSDPFINPSLSNVISEIQLVEVIKKKALVLEKIAKIYETEFDQENSTKYYKISLNTYSLAIELIHRLQIGFESEESKLFISQNQQNTFIEAIATACELYNLTREQKYILKAFEFSEKSKSSNLLAAVKDLKAKEFGGIPDSLLEKEKDYKSYISTYKYKLLEENHLEKPDTQKVNLYSAKIFKYNEEYERLISSFERNYPQYFSLKYENKVIGIKELQSRLNKREAVLEYFFEEPTNSVDKGELILFCVTSDSVKLVKQSLDKSFSKSIQAFHDFLINPKYLDTKKKDYVDYSLAAFGLYKKLIEPVADKIKGKSLTIIPHDKLSYIPFDALISQVPDTARMNFRNLNYLVKDYAISYAYSATLLFESESKKKANHKLLIFSPEYNINNPRKDSETGKFYRLAALPGARDEIMSISKYISSTSYSDKKAQEDIFKKDAASYDILHLAMHTIINDSLPMYSKLVFSKPEVTSSDDGCLNAYEVYNMKLNARLAVLSACETGSGKLQGGEGVMSMARGFIYAGCPSVVMTLWQVEDKSGVNIMSDFYRYLSKGKRKDVALRMAKLNHLENSDPLTAHPHFWLGYVTIGNAEPLYTSKDVYFVVFLFISVILILLDYHYRKKRRQK